MQAAKIGHNNAPTDAEILRDYLLKKNELLLEEAENLALEAEALPSELYADKEAADMTDFVAMVNDCNKRLESIRKNEKEPHLQAGKTVDTFFKKYTEALESAKSRANKPLTAWLVKKSEEEAQWRAAEAERLRKEAEEQAAAATTNEDLNDAIAVEKEAVALERSVEKGVGLASSRGAMGGASLTKRWVGEIEDKKIIDLNSIAKHFSEDAIQKAINSFVATGGRELSGVKIYEKQTAVTRS